MRVLVDECIDERLRNSLTGHDCQTARYAGLAGLKNGELLEAAETAKFSVFLTVDQGIEYQQNLTGPKDCNYCFPPEAEPLERPLASRARLPGAYRIHSTGSDRAHHGGGMTLNALKTRARGMQFPVGL